MKTPVEKKDRCRGGFLDKIRHMKKELITPCGMETRRY